MMLSIEPNAKNGFGHPLLWFGVVCALMALAQVLDMLEVGGSFVPVAAALILTFTAFVFERTPAAMILLILIASTRMVIPPSDREFQELFVPVLAVILIVRSIRREGFRVLQMSSPAILFLLIAAFYFVYRLQGPQSLFMESGATTGFRARWGLLGALLMFLGIVSAFRPEHGLRVARLLLGFYVVVLAIGLLMVVTGVERIPLFTSFSWSLFEEASGTTRMGILGVAGLAVAILLLAYPHLGAPRRLLFWIIAVGGIGLSGGRSILLAFAAALIVRYAVVRKQILRTVLICCAVVAAVGFVSMSPLINIFPASVQRLLVFLPQEFYEEKMVSLSAGEAAAQSSSWRYVLWALALQEIEANPVIGAGFGAPSRAEASDPEQAGLSSLDYLVTGNLHNTYFSITYVMGIPALIVFVVWLGRSVRRLHALFIRSDGNRASLALWLLLALVAHIVQGFGSDIYTALDFITCMAMIEIVVPRRTPAIA